MARHLATQPPSSRRAYRIARRLAAFTHDARAWLNEQVQLARIGVRDGDADGLQRAYERRFPSFEYPGDAVPESSTRQVA